MPDSQLDLHAIKNSISVRKYLNNFTQLRLHDIEKILTVDTN